MKSGLLAILTTSALALGCAPPSKSLGGTGTGETEGDPSTSGKTEGSDSLSATGSQTDGGDSESDSGSGETSTAACEMVKAEAEAFVEQNQACQTHADCKMLDGICYQGSQQECGSIGVNNEADEDVWDELHAQLETLCGECGANACGADVFCNDEGLCEASLNAPIICDLQELAAELLSTSNDAFDNAQVCGHLTLDDPAQDWLAGQQCVLDAQTTGTGFMITHEVEGIDSFPSAALIGIQAETYARFRMFHDEGGVVEGAITTQHECSAFSPVPDCEPAPGNLCIGCADQGENTVICDTTP